MENIADKAFFLRNRLVPALKMVKPDAERRWGKMNFAQMLEHLAESIRQARGSDEMVVVVTPEEQLEKYRSFLSSEKAFRENTPNALLPDVPAPLRHAHVSAAIDEIQAEIDLLFKAFEDEPEKLVRNPIFGDLDYEMTIQLLHKHALHHLRQFGAAN